MAGQTGILQVVNGTGEFNDDGLNAFIRQHGINDIGVGYQIVAITGPQSSGKSTLMNALFGTTFEEMDAMSGRHQTTKGIWLAAAGKVASPRTLLLDLEGSDGRERGEDDNSFERQSSLFALAVSDCLLVNMWAKDVGREAGAGKPLLKTIFQVNLKLFTPAPNRRKTVLLFVFRDRTRTPLARLTETWEEDLRGMWAAITKPPDYEQYSFTDFFEVQYASLPNFEEREEDFRAESVLLRRRFTDEEEDSLVRPASDRLPGHALALSLHKVWEVIQHQKDLNLPAHKVMVANIRCAEIAQEQLRALAEDQAWRGLSQDAKSGLVPSFGARAAALLDSCLTGYDEEARYFEEGVRHAKAKELTERAQGLIHSAYNDQLGHLRAAVLARLAATMEGRDAHNETFAACAARSQRDALAAFEEGAGVLQVHGTDWDLAGPRQEVARAMDAHISQLRTEKVAEFEASAQKALQKSLSGPASALLDRCPSDLWPRLNRLLASSLAKTSQIVAEGLEGYEVPEADLAGLHSRLHQFAHERVEAAAREAANTALPRMKERFTEVFSRDEAGLPRTWGASANIPAVNAAARLAAAHLLAQLALLRLGPAAEGRDSADVVERAVVEQATENSSGAARGHDGAASTRASKAGDDDFDIVAASEWPGVAAERVLLSPSQCRTLWRQFSSDSAYAVQQAQATQEANRAASNRWPPFWAIMAMLVLGWNEFLAVLYNPLWLLAAVLIFLFGKTVYEELDVDAEMARGLLPGALALSAKFGPVVQRVAQRCLEALRQLAADPAAFSERVSERVSEKVAAVRERVGVPDSHSTSNEHAVATGGVMNGVSDSSVRKRRVGAVEMTELSEQSKSSTAL